MTPRQTFRDLFVDNPIVKKDGLWVLARKKTLWGFAAAAVLVGVTGSLVWLSEVQKAEQYGSTFPVGDGLLSIMLGLAFLIAGVLLPAMASSTLAGEREHGTLPLLAISGLSPARIVVGKIAAMLVLVGPFVALPLPGVALGALSIGIDFFPLLVCLCALVTSTVASAAVGVYVSSMTTRGRVAAPAALAAAVVPAFLCAFPALALIAEAVEETRMAELEYYHHSQTVELTLFALGGIFLGAVVAAAAAFGAWSQLAPRTTPRLARATALFMSIIIGSPLVATVLVLLGSRGGNSSFRLTEGFFFFSLLVSAAAVLLYSAGIGRDARAPAPWKMVPTAALAAVGAWVLCVQLADPARHSIDDTGVIAVMHVLAASALASLVAHRVSSALTAAFAGGAAVVILLLVPAILDEVLIGRPPLAFLNVAYAKNADLPVALLFWGSLTVGALVLASRSRRTAAITRFDHR